MGLFNHTDELQVYELLAKQMETVMDVIENHYKVVDAFHKKQFDSVDQCMHDTIRAEGVADGAKTELRRVVSENPFVPSFREDTLELAKKIEAVADSAEASAKFFWITLDLLKRKHAKIPKEIKDNMLELARYAKQISAETHNAIKMLNGGLEDIEQHAKKVGDMEDEADSLEDKTLKNIVDARLEDFLSIELISSVRLLADVIARCNSAVHVLTYMRIARI